MIEVIGYTFGIIAPIAIIYALMRLAVRKELERKSKIEHQHRED